MPANANPLRIINMPAVAAVAQFAAVDSTGALATAGSAAIGFTTAAAKAGGAAPVCVMGSAVAWAGAAITIGQALEIGANGSVVPRVSGAQVGTALNSAAIGDQVEVLISAGGAVSGDGIPLPDYRTKTEQALAQAFRIRAQKAAPAIPETTPTSSATTAGYYIDGVAGSNAAAGTLAAPVKDFWKIGGNKAGGTTYYVACDGSYEYAQPLTDYINAPLFGINTLQSSTSSAAAPLKVTTYNPRKVANPGRPVIKWYAQTVVGDWTQEMGIQGGKVWSVAWADATAFRWRFMALLTGIADSVAITPLHDSSNPGTLYAANQFTADANKIYIYVPDGTNPVAYYGSVKICGGRAGGNDRFVLSTFNDSRYIKISNLHFYGVRVWNIANYNSVGFVWAGLEIYNCTITKCPIAVIVRNNGGTTATELEFSGHHNDIYSSPTTTFHIVSGGVAGNTVSWDVYANYQDGGNLANDALGSLVYNQAIGGAKHQAWGNYGINILNGVGAGQIDGSFIYADVGNDKTLVYGNIIERSGLALQANLAKNYVAVSNLAIDCACLLNITHAGLATTDTTYTTTVAHNTWLWTGRVGDMNSLSKGQNVGGDTNADWTKQSAIQFITPAGSSVGPISIVNNLVLNASDTDYPNKPGIGAQITRSSAMLLVGNAVAGMSTSFPVAEITTVDGRVSDQSTSLGMGLIGTRANAKSWVADASRGIARPSLTSPLMRSGAQLSLTYKDIEGKDFGSPPTPGCYEVNA